jgi:hypothetical protein
VMPSAARRLARFVAELGLKDAPDLAAECRLEQAMSDLRIELARQTPHRLVALAASVLVILSCLVLVGCAGPPPVLRDRSDRRADFEARCNAPGVIRCLGFDSESETDKYIFPPWGERQKRARIVSDVKVSGAGSLRFDVPSNSANDSSGSFQLNFADDLSVQFGEGDEFFVQWRQRFSPDFLATYYRGGHGWKQIVIGEGDRSGFSAPGCTQLELVVQNVNQDGFPQMYHSCGGKDGRFEPLGGGGRYVANEWMTFMVRVKIGTWYKNDGNYRGDSTVQLWVAREGQSARLKVNWSPGHDTLFGVKIPGMGSGYDLANNNPAAKYGKLILTPYHTGKDPTQRHPIGYVWYDELLIATSRIPDPQ